jgi:hypothetical protein
MFRLYPVVPVSQVDLDNHLTIDLDDAFHLDGEDLIVLLVKLTSDTISLSLLLGDLLTILIEAHLGDEATVDSGAAHVVIALVADQVGKLDPLTPGEASIFSGEGAILTLLLDRSDVVIVDTETALEGGLLEDFSTTLAHLHGTNGLEGCDGPLHVQKALNAGGESDGEGGSVAHASSIIPFSICQVGVYLDSLSIFYLTSYIIMIDELYRNERVLILHSTLFTDHILTTSFLIHNNSEGVD